MPDINMQQFGELQRNQHSIDVEIDASQVASPQQDFPMMLETPNSSNSVLNVVAFNELGEQLPTEIEGVANNKNWIHLKDLVQNVTNRKMKVFYGSCAGKPAADSTYGSQAVWNGNHKFVSHMNNDPGGTPPQLSDSTQNTNNGTSGGAMTSADLVDDDNGKAIEFDGNDYFDCGADASIRADITDFTIIYRVKQPATSVYQGIIATAKNTGTYGYRTGISNSGLVEVLIGDASSYEQSYGTTVMDDNTWRTATVTVDSSYLRVYVNGVAEGTPTARTKTIVYDNNLIIGNWANLTASDYFIGSLSESRILNIAKSTNYIATIHNNLNNPTASGIDPFYKSISEEHNFAESLQSLGRAG